MKANWPFYPLGELVEMRSGGTTVTQEFISLERRPTLVFR
jgi:hypothetical protein